MPAPRAMHSLTTAGPFCVLLGGSGPLGPLSGVHLLESPAMAGGLAQQQHLAGLLADASALAARCGQLEADLRLAQAGAEAAAQQVRAVEERCVGLVQAHNKVIEDAEALRAALAAAEEARRKAEEAAQEAKLAAAAAERRLARARQGGREVAAAAEGLHAELQEARECAPF